MLSRKLASMMQWYRSFHGQYPLTIVITNAAWKQLCTELQYLRRTRKFMGAKIQVISPKISGRSIPTVIIDDVELDLSKG